MNKNKKAFEELGKLGAEFLKDMLSRPSPAHSMAVRLVPPFGTVVDRDGVVHRTGMTEANQNGDSFLVKFCSLDGEGEIRSDPSAAVTCVVCLAV